MVRRLKNNEYKTFEQLVSLTQREVHASMHSFLRSKYNEVIATKKWLYAKGDIPIALVAHMDTVFKQPVKELYYDERKNVMWSPEGLGADDRAGIFAIIQIIRAGLRPHIILTTDEEIGCKGAMALAKRDCPFENLKYMIQLDRHGTNDCVFYDVYNPDFIDYVESFGFCEEWGSYSDISELCPAWKVCGVNLSVGYIEEHSYAEHLHVGALLKTIDKVKVMLQEEEIPDFEYMVAPTKWWMTEFPTDDPRYDYGGHCSRCHELFSEYDMFPVKGADSTTKFYCPDCLVGRVEWCDICGEPFECDDGVTKICNDCKDKIQAQEANRVNV